MLKKYYVSNGELKVVISACSIPQACIKAFQKLDNEKLSSTFRISECGFGTLGPRHKDDVFMTTETILKLMLVASLDDLDCPNF